MASFAWQKRKNNMKGPTHVVALFQQFPWEFINLLHHHQCHFIRIIILIEYYHCCNYFNYQHHWHIFIIISVVIAIIIEMLISISITMICIINSFISLWAYLSYNDNDIFDRYLYQHSCSPLFHNQHCNHYQSGDACLISHKKSTYMATSRQHERLQKLHMQLKSYSLFLCCDAAYNQ